MGTGMKIVLVLIIIGAIFIVLQVTGLLQIVIDAVMGIFQGIIDAIMGLFPH